MHDNKLQSRKRRAPVALRGPEFIGLLAVVYGLASSKLWWAVFGVACIALSYWLYRNPDRSRAQAGRMTAGRSGMFMATAWTEAATVEATE